MKRRWPLMLAIVAGLIARIIFWNRGGQRSYDHRILNNWGANLYLYPWREFYGRASYPDHLPGDVVLIGAVAKTFPWLHTHHVVSTFPQLWVLIPTLADFALGLLLVLILRQHGVKRAEWIGAVIVASPAYWSLSSYWGGWISLSLAEAALIAYLARRASPVASLWSAFASAFALLTSPLNLLLVMPALLYRLRNSEHRWREITLLVPTLGVTTWLLVHPLGLTLLPGPHSLWARYAYAAGRFHALNAGAGNFSSFFTYQGLHDPGLAEINALGHGLELLAIAIMLLMTWLAWHLRSRWGFGLSLLWLTTGAYFTAYMVAPAMHERYQLPLVTLITLWAFMRQSWINWTLMVGVHLSYLAIWLTFLIYGCQTKLLCPNFELTETATLLWHLCLLFAATVNVIIYIVFIGQAMLALAKPPGGAQPQA